MVARSCRTILRSGGLALDRGQARWKDPGRHRAGRDSPDQQPDGQHQRQIEREIGDQQVLRDLRPAVADDGDNRLADADGAQELRRKGESPQPREPGNRQQRSRKRQRQGGEADASAQIWEVFIKVRPPCMQLALPARTSDPTQISIQTDAIKGLTHPICAQNL